MLLQRVSNHTTLAAVSHPIPYVRLLTRFVSQHLRGREFDGSALPNDQVVQFALAKARSEINQHQIGHPVVSLYEKIFRLKYQLSAKLTSLSQGYLDGKVSDVVSVQVVDGVN